MNNSDKYTLTFMLEDTFHGSFADAFKSLYSKLQSTPNMTKQLMETTIWITPPKMSIPLMFYGCIEQAHKMNLLTKDGKPTW